MKADSVAVGVGVVPRWKWDPSVWTPGVAMSSPSPSSSRSLATPRLPVGGDAAPSYLVRLANAVPSLLLPSERRSSSSCSTPLMTTEPTSPRLASMSLDAAAGAFDEEMLLLNDMTLSEARAPSLLLLLLRLACSPVPVGAIDVGRAESVVSLDCPGRLRRVK